MWLNRLSWTAYLAYHLRGQTRFPFQSLATIRRVQARRVRGMVAHVYATVPYYRETMDRLGLRPDDFRQAEDFRRLPLLERDQLQRDPEYFVSTAQPLGRYLQVRSGGSSGAPRTVYHDAAALFQNAAHGERERSIHTRLLGKRLGYRELTIISGFSTTAEVQGFCREHAFLPRGARIDRRYASLLEPPERAVAAINAFRPDVVHSYGSYLALLFAHVQATGTPLHRPRLITYSSDSLSDAARHLITEGFGIPVFSTYQSIEAFKIGFECERHRGLHLNLDLYPVRIIDGKGRTLPVDESGDVIVSNLVNRATVLLNYRLGDLAAVLAEPCPCGRTLPLLTFPPGRSDDLIELPTGQVVHPQAIRVMFTDEAQIWQYQVVQVAPSHFRVAIMAGDACDRTATRARLTAKFANVIGEATTVDIDFVDAIERTAAGKFRPVISLKREQRPMTPVASEGGG